MGTTPNPGRRSFLRGEFLTAAGRAGQTRREQPLGPAPPWHIGRVAAQTCRECDGPCATSCEQDIIRRHPGDHDHAGLPYLAFEVGGCTYCRACVTACPMDILATPEIPSIGRAVLHTSKCLAWNGVICITCRSGCGYRAISLDSCSRPRIDHLACTGCGSCVAGCPVQALTVRFASESH